MNLLWGTFEEHLHGVWLTVGLWFSRANPAGRWKWIQTSVFRLPSSRKQFPTLMTVHVLRMTCWWWTLATLRQSRVCFTSPGQKWRSEGCSPFACVWTQDSVLPPSSSACRRRRAGGTVSREEREVDDQWFTMVSLDLCGSFSLFYFVILNTNVNILKTSRICQIRLIFMLFQQCDLRP